MNISSSPRRTSPKRLLLPASLLALALSSCVGHVPVDPAFRQARGSKVAVITMTAPKARVMQQGAQGILDYAINQATSSGRNKRLEDYPSQEKIDAVAGRFVNRLNSLGYKASFLPHHPVHKEFAPYIAKVSAKKPLPGHGSYLQGYDSLLVLDLPVVGQSQLVYAFVPLSTRRATATIQGSMFSCADGRRLWRSPLNAPNYMNGESTQGGNSDINNIFRAIDKAVETQAQAVETDFFKSFY